MSTIILTGAICPSWPMKRHDPVVRLTDYLCAIRRWLDEPSLEQVIYCDASDHRIPEEVFVSDKFESLSFDASEHARKYEAGRAEAESIAFVLENARFQFDFFFKCTGRHHVENFQFIHAEIHRGISCECYLRPWYRPHWADTRFFGMTVEKFRTGVKPRIEELKGQTYQGHVLESLFFEYLNDSSMFPEPEIVGHSGHLNRLYHSDYSQQEKEEAIQIAEEYGLETFGIRS